MCVCVSVCVCSPVCGGVASVVVIGQDETVLPGRGVAQARRVPADVGGTRRCYRVVQQSSHSCSEPHRHQVRWHGEGKLEHVHMKWVEVGSGAGEGRSRGTYGQGEESGLGESACICCNFTQVKKILWKRTYV